MVVIFNKKYGGDEGINAFDKLAIGLSMAFNTNDNVDELLDYLYETLNINKEDYIYCFAKAYRVNIPIMNMG